MVQSNKAGRHKHTHLLPASLPARSHFFVNHRHSSSLNYANRMDGSHQITCVCLDYRFDNRMAGKATIEIKDLEEGVDRLHNFCFGLFERLVFFFLKKMCISSNLLCFPFHQCVIRHCLQRNSRGL